MDVYAGVHFPYVLRLLIHYESAKQILKVFPLLKESFLKLLRLKDL